MSNEAGSGPAGTGGRGGGRAQGGGTSPAAEALASVERSRAPLEARGLGAVADGLEALVRALAAGEPAAVARALQRAQSIADELREDTPCKNRILNLLSRLAGEASSLPLAKRLADELADAVLDRMP